jgi:signal transduction histidine kinase
VTAAGPADTRPSLRGLTVQGWVRLAFAVIAVLAVAGAVIIAGQLVRVRAVTNELARSVLPAQAQAYRLQSALIDQETGVRGYGITGDPRFLQPYQAGLSTQASSSARLHALVATFPPLSADLGRIELAARRWRTDYAAPLIALARRGPLGTGNIAALDRSKNSFDHLRILFAAQNSRLAAVAAQDQARLTGIRVLQDWVFAAILTVLLLAAGGLAALVQRAVIRPLVRLRVASRQVASGDFDHRITPAGPADLRAVAADVEAMRRELALALNDARIAQQIAAGQAADLDLYAEQLRRSNAELEQFAYVASHDLQEPLRKVASFCQLLAQRYDDKLDDRGRQYIEYAVDGAKRLQILINELLAFSRVGRASDVRTRLPMGDALDAAIAALAVSTEESAAVIERPAQLPDVLGDPTLLALVWQNLIGNAIKFRAPGRAPLIRIGVSEHPAGQWQFSIADNGIGISPEFAEKIFVIFQRLHSREAYPGTGIGLAMCRRIIEHHGGQVSLDTSYLDGTRICFTMPQADAGAADQADQGQADQDEADQGQAGRDQADQGQADQAPGQYQAPRMEGITA